MTFFTILITVCNKVSRLIISNYCRIRDSISSKTFIPKAIRYNSIHDKIILSRSGSIKFKDSNSSLTLSDICKNKYPGGDKLYIHGTLRINGNVQFRHGGNRVYIGPKATLEINNNSYFSGNVEINLLNNVYIGSNCAIARHVYITDSDWHTVQCAGSNKNHTTNVHIADNVWIGRNSQILKNSNILNNSIIASSSVTNQDFTEKNILIAGIPAKCKSKNVNWLKQRI